MKIRHSKNHSSPPWGWAWFATFATLSVLFSANFLCSRSIPEDLHDNWHSAMRAADESVTLLGTISLVLLAFITGPIVYTAWIALLGFMIWSGAFLNVVVHGPSQATVMLMLVGSLLILIAHLKHTCRLLARRWARLLQNGPGKHTLVLVMVMMIWISIALSLIPPVRLYV